MWDWDTGVQWWVWGLGIVLVVVFWALVIWAIVALVRWAHGGHHGPGGRGGPGGPGVPSGPWPGEDPHWATAPDDTLTRRYATGEIDADEYQRGLARSKSFAGSGCRS